MWVKAHIGIEGNEKADEASKVGTFLPYQREIITEAGLKMMGKKKRAEAEDEDGETANGEATRGEEDKEEEWKVLEDFGDEVIRGNFMVVCEMEVFKDANGASARGGASASNGWGNGPNFKKFKKVSYSLFFRGRTRRLIGE